MVANAISKALRRCGLEVRSESTRSLCISRACTRRLRSASPRLASGVIPEVEAFGADASACCSSTLFDSQPLDMSLFYPSTRMVSGILPQNAGLTRPNALLLPEAVDHARVKAHIILNRAPIRTNEISSYIGWCKAQRKIGIQVVVGTQTQGKCWPKSIGP